MRSPDRLAPAAVFSLVRDKNTRRCGSGYALPGGWRRCARSVWCMRATRDPVRQQWRLLLRSSPRQVDSAATCTQHATRGSLDARTRRCRPATPRRQSIRAPQHRAFRAVKCTCNVRQRLCLCCVFAGSQSAPASVGNLGPRGLAFLARAPSPSQCVCVCVCACVCVCVCLAHARRWQSTRGWRPTWL